MTTESLSPLDQFILDPSNSRRPEARVYNSALEQMADEGTPNITGPARDLLMGLARRALNLNLPISEEDGKINERIHYKGRITRFQDPNQQIEVFLDPAALNAVETENRQLLARLSFMSTPTRDPKSRQLTRRSENYAVWNNGEGEGLVQVAAIAAAGEAHIIHNHSFRLSDATASKLNHILTECY